MVILKLMWARMLVVRTHMTPVRVEHNLKLMWARMLVVRAHMTPVRVKHNLELMWGQHVGGESTHDTGPVQVQLGTDVGPGCWW